VQGRGLVPEAFPGRGLQAGPEGQGLGLAAQGGPVAEQPRAPLRLHGPGAAEQLEPVPGSLALFLVQFQEQVRGLDI